MMVAPLASIGVLMIFLEFPAMMLALSGPEECGGADGGRLRVAERQGDSGPARFQVRSVPEHGPRMARPGHGRDRGSDAAGPGEVAPRGRAGTEAVPPGEGL